MPVLGQGEAEAIVQAFFCFFERALLHAPFLGQSEQALDATLQAGHARHVFTADFHGYGRARSCWLRCKMLP